MRKARTGTRTALTQLKAVPVDESTRPDVISIYTDGGAWPNPGPGGYGVVILRGADRKERSGAFRRTTNNRMEILAAIVGLEEVRGRHAVTVFSDSRYLVNAIEKGRARKWRAKGWKRNHEEKAANSDLWTRLLALCEQQDVTFVWVPGHSGVSENERADQLAGQYSGLADLPPDEGYERDNWRRPPSNDLIEMSLRVSRLLESDR